MTDTNRTATANACATPAPQVPEMPRIATDSVTAIAPSDRVKLPGPPGLGFLREACIDTDNVWIGFVSTEPGAASPWHHHGEYTTYALWLQGEGVVELGPGGKERVHLRCDGTVYVIPPGVVHREINPGATRNQALIIRVGQGQPVFPADAPSDARP